ncbi:MAG: SRPBCC family protein [Novosphingobium sp.]
MLLKSICRAVAVAVLMQAGSAMAEVKEMTDAGFVIRLTEEVTASPEESWKALLSPADWWSGEHTYSGDAKNLYIDAQATGCFCEKLPRPKDAPEDQRNGSVEHLHVVFAQPHRVLRLTGGLGPLQSEAAHGALTMTLKPVPGGTRILWEYVVGGFVRYKKEQIAPLVDKVLAEQLKRLGARLGAKVPAGESAEQEPAGKGAGEAPAASADVAADFDASIKAPAKPKPRAPAKPAVKKPVAD